MMKLFGPARFCDETVLTWYVGDARLTFYTNGFVNNSSFKQSEIESLVLQNRRVIELKRICSV